MVFGGFLLVELPILAAANGWKEGASDSLLLILLMPEVRLILLKPDAASTTCWEVVAWMGGPANGWDVSARAGASDKS